MIEYGALVTKHDQLFETKWIREQRAPDEIILGNSDPSSLGACPRFSILQRRAGLF
jgi:hypothetical protein